MLIESSNSQMSTNLPHSLIFVNMMFCRKARPSDPFQLATQKIKYHTEEILELTETKKMLNREHNFMELFHAGV